MPRAEVPEVTSEMVTSETGDDRFSVISVPHLANEEKNQTGKLSCKSLM